MRYPGVADPRQLAVSRRGHCPTHTPVHLQRLPHAHVEEVGTESLQLAQQLARLPLPPGRTQGARLHPPRKSRSVLRGRRRPRSKVSTRRKASERSRRDRTETPQAFHQACRRLSLSAAWSLVQSERVHRQDGQFRLHATQWKKRKP